MKCVNAYFMAAIDGVFCVRHARDMQTSDVSTVTPDCSAIMSDLSNTVEAMVEDRRTK